MDLGWWRMGEFFWTVMIGGVLFKAMQPGAVEGFIGARLTAKKQSHKG